MPVSLEPQQRVITGPDTPVPQVQLLSNGSYHVMLSAAGGGYSRWGNLALTRWRDDAVYDNRGSFFFVRDRDSGDLWSATHQPMPRRADSYQADFSNGGARFTRSIDGIEVCVHVAVAGADDVEVRRVRVTNVSNKPRCIELTSYAEVVLAPPATDAAHPAFNKLFVETEIDGQRQAILCTHRPGTPDAATPTMFHLLAAGQPLAAPPTYETDRMAFIGRGRSSADPQGPRVGLTGSAGPVLDPVIAIGCVVMLAPGQGAWFDYVTGIAATRAACLALADKYRQGGAVDQMLLASLQSSNAGAADVSAQLAASLLYANASLRADAATVAANRLGQSALWPFSISGDLPILLLRVAGADLPLARQLIGAHAGWRWHGLAADLVIVCADAQQAALASLAAECGQGEMVGKPGGIFILPQSRLTPADDQLLRTVARVVLNDGAPLAEQLAERAAAPAPLAPRPQEPVTAETVAPDPGLEFANGIGGFDADGREYVITLQAGQCTPVPWVNVLANPDFGTLVSDSGSATTWSENAQAFRLTPWNNDPVSDTNTEAYYLRDEESGHYWSATALPARGSGTYVTRHGFGYSSFTHSEDGIWSELCVFVALDAPVKYARLTLRNRSGRMRRLSATGYLEWVLGDQAEKTRMQIVTSCEGAIFAGNAYNTDFAGRSAFFAADDDEGRSMGADRAAFIGRNGTLRDPAAMTQAHLSGTCGATLDPCAAIRVPFALDDGTERVLVFRLGAETDLAKARALAAATGGAAAAQAAFDKVRQFWERTLGAVQVTTPDRAFDIMTNGWLVYQTLACRLWARNAFYQSSGAFGFRDQLQDVMALVHAVPDEVRAHLLRCAGRQFPEGDVQHWWHPPQGRGVRTLCSDDYLWLPLACCRYVQCSGDSAVLDEVVHFIEGNRPQDGKDCYELPTVSAQSATLYQHCVRALEHGLRFGEHGLPLMGSGDWNDGMNLVGIGGKGESVWLAFFLCKVLAEFGALALRRGDQPFAARCREQGAALAQAIERSAWDGQWYLRAWFDDGNVLGSARNSECRIDSIAQSWSVLSGVAAPQRAHQAMDALEQQLIDADAALVRLLAPPFDKAEPNPGYIKGYLPGVRENGGQYTHAAVWAGMAYAALGDVRRAWHVQAMLSPVRHASPGGVARYKTEPYVLASDVYSCAPHNGRGGWTWYTGSAGWMYRYSVESLLGLRVEGDQLRLDPCVPAEWAGYELRYRYRETLYVIHVRCGAGAAQLTLDGQRQNSMTLTLTDDGRTHQVEVHITINEEATHAK
ncbi:MAG: glycosyl hydrolase family 65 protein [Massilia sp.]